MNSLEIAYEQLSDLGVGHRRVERGMCDVVHVRRELEHRPERGCFFFSGRAGRVGGIGKGSATRGAVRRLGASAQAVRHSPSACTERFGGEKEKGSGVDVRFVVAYSLMMDSEYRGSCL